MNINYNAYDRNYSYSSQPMQSGGANSSAQPVEPNYAYSYQQASYYGVSPYQSRYPAGQYAQPYSGMPYQPMRLAAPKQPASGMAITGLIFGIGAMVCLMGNIIVPIAVLFDALSFLFAIVGIILCGVAKKRGQSGAATTGMVFSIIALCFALIGIIACGGLMGGLMCALEDTSSGGAFDDYSSYSDYYYYGIYIGSILH